MKAIWNTLFMNFVFFISFYYFLKYGDAWTGYGIMAVGIMISYFIS